MYLNLGGGTVVDSKSVVCVFDLDISSQSHITRNYLSAAEKRGEVVNTAEDIPKSYVVCEENGKRTVYLCQPATVTLLKRAESGII